MSKEKNKAMKRIVIFSFLTLGFLFIYTCIISNLSKEAYKEELKHSETVVNEFVKRLSDGESFHSIEGDALKEITKMEKQDATNLVDYALYVLYESVGNKEITEAETEVLKNAINQTGIDITKVKDENLKKNLETYKQMHIIMRYLNGEFLYDVDYDYFIKAYGSHILPEYREILEFYLLEKTKDYYSSETLTLFPEEVERRLEILYDMVDEKENGVQDIAMGAYLFYKSIYLGEQAGILGN